MGHIAAEEVGGSYRGGIFPGIRENPGRGPLVEAGAQVRQKYATIGG